ncbi:unnamed protein product [Dovyalis caffra]|uniref:Uncharacterized protein n=1 Tax=Dovyalis caffra TaxID=77055 RepID=A0AAV1RT27_9ROSI|nr:unnamed protein product [Dovyalis caffra]
MMDPPFQEHFSLPVDEQCRVLQPPFGVDRCLPVTWRKCMACSLDEQEHGAANAKISCHSLIIQLKSGSMHLMEWLRCQPLFICTMEMVVVKGTQCGNLMKLG